MTPGEAPAVVREYARQVISRLPEWQADGLPAAESRRVRELSAPVADGAAQLGLGPCPTD